MPTKFVLFDLTPVTGLDATAARACFLNLTRTLAPIGECGQHAAPPTPELMLARKTGEGDDLEHLL